MTKPKTQGALALALPTAAIASTLRCRAAHPDPRKKGKPCGGFLGHVIGEYEFVTTAKKAPDQKDGYLWLKCASGRCGLVNKFRLLATSQALTAEMDSVEARFERLKPTKQQAVLALAGGMSVSRTAIELGLTRETLHTWKNEEEFAELCAVLAPAISGARVRRVLRAFDRLIDRDAKQGRGTNIRYFLSRTVFADFERAKAQAKGGPGVSVSVLQHQERTETSIRGLWEVRAKGLPAALAPEDEITEP